MEADDKQWSLTTSRAERYLQWSALKVNGSSVVAQCQSSEMNEAVFLLLYLSGGFESRILLILLSTRLRS